MPEIPNRRPRILSGMRPTGRLHLGNYVGALDNWIKLQNEDRYDSYHFVADWHMLTTEYAEVAELQHNIQEMVTDWLASGLDPNKSTFFIQSRIPEHAELHLLFSMITPLGWLERVPTYKEQIENLKGRDLHTYGFLGYPVLQAADILMYKAYGVPVGEDQVPHVELTREIARRFNLDYGKSSRTGVKLNGMTYSEASTEGKAELIQRGLVNIDPVFPEPEALLTPSPRLPGTDGRKMSKSYGNAIFLSDPEEVVWKKVSTMMTDPARKRRWDKGNPEICPVFDFHKIFSSPEVIDRVNRECRTAEVGCVECKKLMAGYLNQFLSPIRQRRMELEQCPGQVWDVLEIGTQKAREVAQTTMTEVRSAMNLIRS
ncbi:MAG TPA: tryptophan--tRNA ligase [Terriglobia bacterium]|nr:tryptophan--tRNA ligase [Terriglobia bacterium]